MSPLPFLLALCLGQAPADHDLAGFIPVEKALTTQLAKTARATAPQPGYLGVHLAPGLKGPLVVDHVDPDSPAAKAGLRPGDFLTRVGGQLLADADALRELLFHKAPGQELDLHVLRQGVTLELKATLAAPSRPASQAAPPQAALGIEVGSPKEGEGVKVERVAPGSAAATAGLQVGDVLLKIDARSLDDPGKLNGIITEKRPGDAVTLSLVRAGKPLEVKATLTEAPGFGRFGKGGSGWDTRGMMGAWKKDVYRLAVVCIEYPDTKGNDKIKPTDWEDALFSRGTYNKKSVTGQTVYGSMNDYYHELSYGTFRVEGKAFPWVKVSKPRKEYDSSGANRTALLGEALDKLLERDGKEALKDFDGIFFMYAGGRIQTVRGSLYWPHRASFSHHGKRWPYFICPEGGGQMASISVICHEFGHMLGLPDLYARPENPGSEGVGAWCAMSQQAGNGRPQHFSAWCKEQLGWIKPVVIDPAVPQKLILAPIYTSPRECVKVLVRPDGSEYFLLENRNHHGFDKSLQAEGLLIWRVVRGRPILEESHGVTGPAGPRVFPTSVPFPSGSNDAFTPYTMPSSRGQLSDDLPVHITNIRRLPDGRVTFYVGYEFY